MNEIGRVEKEVFHYEGGKNSSGGFFKRRPAKIVLDKEDVEDRRLVHWSPFTLLPTHVVIFQQQLSTLNKKIVWISNNNNK